MELRDQLKELVLDNYGRDSTLAEAFAEGFEKEASGYNFISGGVKGVLGAAEKVAEPYLSNPKIGEALLKSGLGLAAGLATIGIVKGINSTSDYIGMSKLRNKFEMALAQVLATNRVVKGASPDRAKSYAETIFKFAPNVAADPNLLGSILANAVLGEGIDSMTIKSLVDLEGRYRENTSQGSLPGIRS